MSSKAGLIINKLQMHADRKHLLKKKRQEKKKKAFIKKEKKRKKKKAFKAYLCTNCRTQA